MNGSPHAKVLRVTITLFSSPSALVRIAMTYSLGATRRKSRARARQKQWLLIQALGFPQWWQETCHGHEQNTGATGGRRSSWSVWGGRVLGPRGLLYGKL